jgi:hypothetical protein
MQSSSASRKRSRTEEHPPSRAAPASRSTSRPQARSHSLFTSADLLLFDQLHARVQFDCPALWSRFDVEKFQLTCSQVSALGLHKDGRWVNWQSYASAAARIFLPKLVDFDLNLLTQFLSDSFAFRFTEKPVSFSLI